MSSFNTISVALSGLMAYQKSIEVTSHNVANVNTPGYHRQEAILRAGMPGPPPGSTMSQVGGMFGTGVEVSQVRRLQDAFVQQQLNMVEGQIGHWATSKDGLSQIESVLAPGQNLDVSSMLDNFFGAWQQLASQPEELGSRMAVRSQAVNLTTALNETVKKIDFVGTQANDNLDTQVDRLNLLADQLGTLNGQLGLAKAEGRDANDLMDQRESILNEMTTIAGTKSLSLNEGNSITNLGGRALVEGKVVNHLVVKADASGTPMVTWAEDGAQANISEGNIAGLYEIRDKTIPQYKDELDTIASALSSAINTLHQTGVTMNNTPAGDFFVGATAGSIHVSDAILADANNISATRNTDAIGDGTLANDIYGLYTQPLIGSQTLNQMAQGVIGQIGNAVKSAQTNLDGSQALKTQMTSQQQQVSGVSLDEEMTNMMIYQRAYDASARIMVTADDMMKTLIQTLSG